MSSNPLRLEKLLTKYLDNSCTPEELKEFWKLMGELGENDTVGDLLETLWKAEEGDEDGVAAGGREAIRRKILARVFEKAGDQEIDFVRLHRPKTTIWRRMTAAAAILLIGAAAWLWTYRPVAPTTPPTLAKTTDIAPGGNHAVLTLANGKTIILDTVANGILAQQGATSVRKTSNERIAYIKGGGAGVENNTLTTPRGGQYQLTLSDGTRVWLNAQSSITYPTAFVGKNRAVTVTGEAYFEVVHNAQHPFIVKAAGQLIEDIGTAFNVNAYPDEPVVKTTLLEGAVRLRKNGIDTRLRPGEQATIDATGALRVNYTIDTAAVMAWKNGFFSFDHTDLQTVMRQLARWYDVQVEYRGKIPDMTFGGEITRNTNASQVLRILEESNVHFSIENKTIIVTP